jgi:predicted NAD/FAD-binding protein
VKIAIIGTGISGLTAAHYLQHDHDLTLFEANDYVGGHTNTVTVSDDGRPLAVDTGFIVFNDWTYPNFTRLLNELQVASQPSQMGFSVRCERTGLEYNGTSVNALFAQRRNLVSPPFLRMVRDIVRFNWVSRELLDGAAARSWPTLGEYLRARRFSREFIEHFIVPMGAAIWSADPRGLDHFPAETFARFFANHGFLNLLRRPQWRVVQGGSRSYVQALIRPLTATAPRIRLSSPVRSVRRHWEYVAVTSADAVDERFDRVILATHSDQTLALLADATPREREILEAFVYQENEAVLHTDTSLLPRNPLAWASWNYHLLVDRPQPNRAIVTYNMNLLQGLTTRKVYCVTLNHSDVIDPAKTLRRITYHHPVFTEAAIRAQARHGEISGQHRTHFCGAYWGYGFHEDGVRSGLRVCNELGRRLEVTAAARRTVWPTAVEPPLVRRGRAALAG